MTTTTTRSVFAVALLLAPALVFAQGDGGDDGGHTWTAAAPSREELTSLEGHLERAVAEVSVPHAGILLGRATASRGYRLPGYGVVFVLTPRALPGGERAVYVFRGHPQGLPAPRPHPGLDVTVAVEDVEIEAVERQVLVLQHAAEAQRRAAEEDHERIVRDIRIRLAGPGGEEGGDHARPVVVEESPVGEGGSSEPPPWSFWFGDEPAQEGRSADRVVDDVRGAVIQALETRAPEVSGLTDDEFVTVAVDFVPGGFFASHRRPTRTLIVRSRRGDLVARAQGRIAGEEWRRRVEVIEY